MTAQSPSTNIVLKRKYVAMRHCAVAKIFAAPHNGPAQFLNEEKCVVRNLVHSSTPKQ